jgi:glucose/mannose-6-phosphate isomerase
MRQAIERFPEQFLYKPLVENREKLGNFDSYIVVGMGGSHLSADILKSCDPCLNLIVHRNYGLPCLKKAGLKKSLIILSSYSGNTEEVIDAFYKAKESKLAAAAISTGGKLLQLAKKHSLPYIQLPQTGIQPRSALGFSIKALLKLMRKEKALKEISSLKRLLNVKKSEKKGKQLAEKLKNKVPIIYSSQANEAVAYNWKIKFNETGKIPAFYNVVPELNHNEMTGFDIKKPTKKLSKNFYFIFLEDKTDNPRILKRFKVLKKLYLQKGLAVETLLLEGKNKFHKIFSSLLTADWAAFYTAKIYGLDPENVPLVEEFKKRL